MTCRWLANQRFFSWFCIAFLKDCVGCLSTESLDKVHDIFSTNIASAWWVFPKTTKVGKGVFACLSFCSYFFILITWCKQIFLISISYLLKVISSSFLFASNLIFNGVKLIESLNSSDCGRWLYFVSDPSGWALILPIASIDFDHLLIKNS